MEDSHYFVCSIWWQPCVNITYNEKCGLELVNRKFLGWTEVLIWTFLNPYIIQIMLTAPGIENIPKIYGATFITRAGHGFKWYMCGESCVLCCWLYMGSTDTGMFFCLGYFFLLHLLQFFLRLLEINHSYLFGDWKMSSIHWQWHRTQYLTLHYSHRAIAQPWVGTLNCSILSIIRK